MKFNEEHGIIPHTIAKAIREVIDIHKNTEPDKKSKTGKNKTENIASQIELLTKEMQKAAKELNFEQAAMLRDMIIQLKARK